MAPAGSRDEGPGASPGRPIAPGPRALLDAAAGQPLHPAGRAALLAALDAGWADPVRLYREARQARMLLDAARESVAAALGARPAEVSFASSGTAALHLGVLGVLRGRSRAGRGLVVGAVEHSAVLRAGDAHEAAGGLVAAVGVDGHGRVDAEEFAAACGQGTALACLQQGNHEVGTLQPVAEVAALLAGRGVPLLVDAAAATGRLPPPEGWSVLATSAHKWGGPAGLGVLAVRPAARWRSPAPADDRESGRVPGFPAVPLAVAAAAALEAVERDRAAESARLSALADRLRAGLPARVPEVVVLGDPRRRLPHLVTCTLLYADADAVVRALDAAGIAVASGSACAADTRRPSHVLVAMGALTHGNIRVSLPQGCPASDVDRLLDALPPVVAEVRAALGVDQ